VLVLDGGRVARETERLDDEAPALRRARRNGSLQLVDVDVIDAREHELANFRRFVFFVARALGVESRGQTRRQQ